MCVYVCVCECVCVGAWVRVSVFLHIRGCMFGDFLTSLMVNKR